MSDLPFRDGSCGWALGVLRLHAPLPGRVGSFSEAVVLPQNVVLWGVPNFLFSTTQKLEMLIKLI